MNTYKCFFFLTHDWYQISLYKWTKNSMSYDIPVGGNQSWGWGRVGRSGEKEWGGEAEFIILWGESWKDEDGIRSHKVAEATASFFLNLE